MFKNTLSCHKFVYGERFLCMVDEQDGAKKKNLVVTTFSSRVKWSASCQFCCELKHPFCSSSITLSTVKIKLKNFFPRIISNFIFKNGCGKK